MEMKRETRFSFFFHYFRSLLMNEKISLYNIHHFIIIIIIIENRIHDFKRLIYYYHIAIIMYTTDELHNICCNNFFHVCDILFPRIELLLSMY